MSEGGSPVQAEPSPSAMDAALRIHKLTQQVKTAAGWLWLVAVLTVVNAVLWLSGSTFRMIAGLLVTRVAIRVLGHWGTTGLILEVVLAAIAAGVFTLLAVLSSRRIAWMLLVAAALYAGDTLLFLVFNDWVGFAFHVFGVVLLVQGYLAARKLGPLVAARHLSRSEEAPLFDVEEA